jgi:hypothetical protein
LGKVAPAPPSDSEARRKAGFAIERWWILRPASDVLAVNSVATFLTTIMGNGKRRMLPGGRLRTDKMRVRSALQRW